jgi:hypothetical protein
MVIRRARFGEKTVSNKASHKEKAKRKLENTSKFTQNQIQIFSRANK